MPIPGLMINLGYSGTPSLDTPELVIRVGNLFSMGGGLAGISDGGLDNKPHNQKFASKALLGFLLTK